MLVDSLEFLDQAQDEKRECTTHLGGNVVLYRECKRHLRGPWTALATTQSNRSRTYQEGNNVKTGRIRQIEKCGQYDL